MLRPYANFFQPVVKLAEKTRIGSQVRKRYDLAKTPYRRLLAWEGLDPQIRERVGAVYVGLNPAERRRKIERVQRLLLKEVAGQSVPMRLSRAGQN